jgi:hypothetical protein
MNELEGLLRLAEASWREADSRRSLEWKVSFGLWTGLGLVSGFLLTHHSQILNCHPTVVCILAALFTLTIWLVYTCVWMRGNHHRNHRYQRRAHCYWRLAEERLEITPRHTCEPEEEKLPPLFCDWAYGPQIVFTLILTAVAFLSVLLNIRC